MFVFELQDRVRIGHILFGLGSVQVKGCSNRGTIVQKIWKRRELTGEQLGEFSEQRSECPCQNQGSVCVWGEMSF